MTTSIVMTTYNRSRQLLNTLTSISKQFEHDDILGQRPEIVVVDDGDDDRTAGICDAFDAKWIRTGRVHDGRYMNQALPLNIGIRVARGDVLIIQNAECKHMGDVIDRLTRGLLDNVVRFAHVTALTEDGKPDAVYCGESNPRPYFFCGAVHRDVLLALGGFDEDYVGYGYEDDDMADRLTRSGIVFRFTDARVLHQWHEPAGFGVGVMEAGRAMFERKRLEPVIRNVGREWGMPL